MIPAILKNSCKGQANLLNIKILTFFHYTGRETSSTTCDHRNSRIQIRMLRLKVALLKIDGFVDCYFLRGCQYGWIRKKSPAPSFPRRRESRTC